ncbi:B-cell receptor CD22-like isoform X1 [Pygocentrus nattereri]|uniref:B-cell receptor CD22-like isoform X1 n=1 Tax=Pygocentrus nattereri TaxID=42514 RepID=UPI001891C02C|nr:B-cell receptor CD22-like isoform X1 [Pygocentrus nattereri]
MMCSMLLWASVKTVGLLFLALSGSLGQNWRVTHIPSKICTLHHTSVVLPCKLTYPTGEMVTTSVWHYKKQTDAEPVVVPVVQEFGEHVEDCSLTLNNMTQDNAGIYQFSFTTDISTQNLTNEDGVTLEITDLEVEMVSKSDVVLEGEWVTLVCGTCIPSITLPTYIWHKDGRPHSRTHGVNQLDLEEAKPEDSGSYSCSINGHEGLLSSAVNFTVKWPPKNVSVSISWSGELVEGSSVTLTCSSDANPSVKIYTWFKEGETSSVGSGHQYSFSLNPRSDGLYYCEAKNEYGSLRSASVLVVLNAGYTVILYVPVGVGFCGVVVIAIAIGFCLRCKRHKQNRKPDKHDFQNAGQNAKDDTYTALDLTTRTNDNVYEVLGNVHLSPPVDACISGHSDYENVANLDNMMNTNQS